MEEDPDVDKKACHLNRQPRKCLLHHTAKFGPNMVDLDTLDTTMQPGPEPWAGIVEYQQMAEFVLCTCWAEEAMQWWRERELELELGAALGSGGM